MLPDADAALHHGVDPLLQAATRMLKLPSPSASLPLRLRGGHPSPQPAGPALPRGRGVPTVPCRRHVRYLAEEVSDRLARPLAPEGEVHVPQQQPRTQRLHRRRTAHARLSVWTAHTRLSLWTAHALPSRKRTAHRLHTRASSASRKHPSPLYPHVLMHRQCH